MIARVDEDIERRHVCVSLEVDVAGRRVTIRKPYSIDALIDAEDFSRDERLPYWAELWPAARVLSDVLALESGDGRTCLELGCGLGLTSIAALMAGYDVTASDYYEDALAFARTNALHAVGRAPATRLVDWRDLPGDLGTFDRVVAADVLYERTYGPLVAGALDRTLRAGGIATVADPGRVAAEVFVRACEELGLELTAMPVRELKDGAATHRVRLLELRRAADR
ncbi:MAG TPA: methyltransferase domain-containing protein [Gemmatimonadaceae bacterium]|nr:methyltransferase domain-containing protein [Gemmatimonadaceae bacterium]